MFFQDVVHPSQCLEGYKLKGTINILGISLGT